MVTSAAASTTGLQVLTANQAAEGMVRLEVRDVRVDILTGIYSEETKLPQPLNISVIADLPAPTRFEPDTPLSASKNYLDLRWAMDEAIPRNVHFTLIEAVAEHICDTLFVQDPRIARVEVSIVKIAISHNGEAIGMTLVRQRP
ncbi:MAG: dihydroneopterin aldolase [Rhizorhabdus sp.]|nr:dihydroneopterin aldolase [Rhizorhabdus sp.]